MPWSLEVTRPAKKDLVRLGQRERQAMSDVLDSLTGDISSADIRKLQGRENEWRLRVGEVRAILELDNATGTIRVLRILPRGRAYRD
jgi:mRNA interferase RelE/StbE